MHVLIQDKQAHISRICAIANIVMAELKAVKSYFVTHIQSLHCDKQEDR